MACWNPLNIPAIKTEPRDTSPQPFGLYRAPPELTPSPQPLSPNSAFNHNTPSPYSIASTTAGTQGNNQQIISPNQQQYNAGNGGSAPSGSGGGANMNDYNAFGQQTQQQQQYHGNNFGGAGATHWESKYNPSANTANNNLGNLNTTTPFTMPNLLSAANGGPGNGPPGTQGTGNASGAGWNLAPNHFYGQHLNIFPQDPALRSALGLSPIVGLAVFQNITFPSQDNNSVGRIITIFSWL
ncbi:uncharacterized protein LOC142225005 [Haematobia irritans]|uniref:uncharacterized protein LOC142225005 n=1 Tax=Haematobia irritans TaxID=7368 RepID=UPI003F4FFF9B